MNTGLVLVHHEVKKMVASRLGRGEVVDGPMEQMAKGWATHRARLTLAIDQVSPRA